MFPCPAELCRFLFEPSESGCPSTPPCAKRCGGGATVAVAETPEGKPRRRVSSKRPLCDLPCPPTQRSKLAGDASTAAKQV
jgi:hypothetical protein